MRYQVKSSQVKFTKKYETQLRRQAKEMSRNPELVRRANPEMRSLTDAQIRQHAKEMEKMAANPELIQTMAKVQSMPESERTALNQLQEGLSGKVVRDDKWINDTIRLVKSHPETLKMLFKGRVPKDSPLSEKQLMSIVDYVVTLSDWVLVNSVHLINWGIRDGVAYYKKVDDLTFGCARWIVLVVMLVLMFYVAKLVWYIVWYTFAIVMSGYRLITNGSAATGAAGGADSANAATPEPSAIGKEQVFAEAPFVDLSSEL